MCPTLLDVEILHFLSLSDLDYYETAGGIEDLFRHNAFFIGKSLRKYIKSGQADYTPMLLSEIPWLFKLGKMHLDTALIQVSPPDRYGFCSYGINVDIVKPIAESAEYVVAEINPKMPRTLGDSFIHIDDIDAFVESKHDIIEFSYGKPDDVSRKIAKFVASLIEDESTINMSLTDAVNKLRGKVGTKVTITIRRPGEPKLLDYTITRDVIEIKSVPFYGMINDEIGYIRLTRFSQEASKEIADALRSLKDEGAKSLILDLRSNPGGLLRQAVEVIIAVGRPEIVALPVIVPNPVKLSVPGIQRKDCRRFGQIPF